MFTLFIILIYVFVGIFAMRLFLKELNEGYKTHDKNLGKDDVIGVTVFLVVWPWFLIWSIGHFMYRHHPLHKLGSKLHLNQQHTLSYSKLLTGKHWNEL